MSQENVETVRRALDAVIGSSWPEVLAELDPAIEIEDTVIPDASDYRGHDGFFRWLARWNESWEDWRLEEIEILLGSDNHVVALLRMVAEGKGSGIQIDRPDAVVYTLRDSKIVRMGYYNDQAKALAAAGLTEQA
jgi:ketosteroid isomerase-like protein